MRTVIKSSLAIFALSFILISCGGEEAKDKENHEGHNHSEQSGEKYACPMKCEKEKTYSEEGKCPVCEMDLEKVK